MKILVTGGAGFIGSHVADAYIREGHSVVIVDNLSMGKVENINPRARFLEADIRDAAMIELIERERFDVINHHAAQMDVRRSVEDPLFDASVNILGTLNLLEYGRRFGVKKFIFASTGGAVYGEQEYFPADENHPTRPVSPYGISKLAIEQYLFYYGTVHGLTSIVQRYANVYGPRQNPHGEAGVVAIFTSRMLAGQQPLINGDGLQTRDYVYVEDVVTANLRSLTHARPAVVNIGTGVETSVNEVFSILRDLTRSTCDEIHGSAKKGEQLRSVLDCARAKSIFDWSPTVTIRDGLRETVEYFKSRMPGSS